MANILIVDDDDHLCACITEFLAASGHTCLVAGNAQKALQALQMNSLDLIILDVMIPGISGFELCRRIHASPELYDIPILFLSAMNSEEEIAHGLAQGADDFLAKPFKGDVLKTRVERLLASRGLERLKDDMTGLCGSKGIKLDLQRAVTMRQTFGVAYIELLYLNEFSRSAGNDGRGRAIRHLARGLQICAEELKSENIRAGHMGSGHFVCILESSLVESYGNRVRKMWERHCPRLYESVGVHAPLQDPGSGVSTPLLDVLYCATVHTGAHKTGVQEIFETLTHLRDNARSRRGGGVFIDRRG